MEPMHDIGAVQGFGKKIQSRIPLEKLITFL